jgi:hypothetical protein
MVTEDGLCDDDEFAFPDQRRSRLSLAPRHNDFAHSGHGVEVSTSVSYAPLTTKTRLFPRESRPTNGINFEEKGVSAIIQIADKARRMGVG